MRVWRACYVSSAMDISYLLGVGSAAICASKLQWLHTVPTACEYGRGKAMLQVAGGLSVCPSFQNDYHLLTCAHIDQTSVASSQACVRHSASTLATNFICSHIMPIVEGDLTRTITPLDLCMSIKMLTHLTNECLTCAVLYGPSSINVCSNTCGESRGVNNS